MAKRTRAWVALAALAGLTSLAALPANATPMGLTGPVAVYPAPFGSAHVAQVVSDLDVLLGTTAVCYVGRLNSAGPATTCAGVTAASLSGTGLSGQSGTWSFAAGATGLEIVGLEINGGSNGNLYLVTPPATSGVWDTFDFVNPGGAHPDLSHLDFYAMVVDGGTIGGGGGAAPEPASVLLLAAGLLGLGAARRRKSA